MPKFVSFPKIGQYRNMVQGLTQRLTYRGKDEDGNPLYAKTEPLPKITFCGTTKIHGSNGGIIFHEDEVWFQSRSNVITSKSDNMGFATAFEPRIEELKKIRDEVVNEHSLNLSKGTLCLFGEWHGSSIQKGVAVAQLSKRFVLFAIRYVEGEQDVDGNWTVDEFLPINFVAERPEIDFYNIMNYKTWEVEVDLEEPALATQTLEKIVEEVEAECPYAAAHGAKGLGEGVVFSAWVEGKYIQFKVKGEKHSATKVKKVASVDPEKIASVNEFVSNTVTENRLEQALQQVFGDERPTVKGTGKFLGWLANDILVEEADTMEANGLEKKDVTGPISKVGREWFFKHLDKITLGE